VFDAQICCSSWDEADAIAVQARAAGFRVEVLTYAIDIYSSAVFLKIWCTGNADRGAEIGAIVDPIGAAIVEDYSVEDDRGQLC
jgi:hypothetical protein